MTEGPHQNYRTDQNSIFIRAAVQRLHLFRWPFKLSVPLCRDLGFPVRYETAATCIDQNVANDNVCAVSFPTTVIDAELHSTTTMYQTWVAALTRVHRFCHERECVQVLCGGCPRLLIPKKGGENPELNVSCSLCERDSVDHKSDELSHVFPTEQQRPGDASPDQRVHSGHSHNQLASNMQRVGHFQISTSQSTSGPTVSLAQQGVLFPERRRQTRWTRSYNVQ